MLLALIDSWVVVIIGITVGGVVTNYDPPLMLAGSTTREVCLLTAESAIWDLQVSQQLEAVRWRCVDQGAYRELPETSSGSGTQFREFR